LVLERNRHNQDRGVFHQDQEQKFFLLNLLNSLNSKSTRIFEKGKREKGGREERKKLSSEDAG